VRSGLHQDRMVRVSALTSSAQTPTSRAPVDGIQNRKKPDSHQLHAEPAFVKSESG
jgi:hypothetical protein